MGDQDVTDENDMARDEAELADVVLLHPDRDLTDEDAPVSSTPRPPWCAHKRVILHEEAHRMTCRECEREVDPFKFLFKLAGDWQRYANHRKEAHRRAQEAHARLEELLRLERNARARLKRIDPAAAKSAPQVPWGDANTGNLY